MEKERRPNLQLLEHVQDHSLGGAGNVVWKAGLLAKALALNVHAINRVLSKAEEYQFGGRAMAQPIDSSTDLAGDDRSASEILRDLVREAGRIVRDEVELARTEFGEKAACVRKAGGALAVAAAAGLLAGACLTTACIAALALVVPVWLAAILIGTLLAIIAGGAYIVGHHQMEGVGLTPHRTVTTLKEDLEWAKQRTES